MDEKQLLERLRRRDPEALELLWQDYHDTLYRFICAIMRTPLVKNPATGDYVRADSDAKDVLADTFIAAHEGINDFKGKCKLKTWLYRIAQRRAADFYRSEDRQRLQSEDSTVEDDSPESEIPDEIGTSRGSLEPEPNEERLKPRTRALAAQEAANWNSGNNDVSANGITEQILLQTALCELTAQQRQAIVLKMDGNTFKEIGVALEITEGAAKMAFVRGIKALRKHLTKESADNRAEVNPQ